MSITNEMIIDDASPSDEEAAPLSVEEYYEQTIGTSTDSSRRCYGRPINNRALHGRALNGQSFDGLRTKAGFEGQTHKRESPLKLEHKRARNREAASRCRKRKLDRIATLEAKVAQLNKTNESLLEVTAVLTGQISQLKQQVIQHVTAGCDISLNPLLDHGNELSNVTQHEQPQDPSTCLSRPYKYIESRTSPLNTPQFPSRTPSSPTIIYTPLMQQQLNTPVLQFPPSPPSFRSQTLSSPRPESPEVEDVCLNLTVSSRRSPDCDHIERGLKEEEVIEENGNVIELITYEPAI